jgi:hypothetical protein
MPGKDAEKAGRRKTAKGGEGRPSPPFGAFGNVRRPYFITIIFFVYFRPSTTSW